MYAWRFQQRIPPWFEATFANDVLDTGRLMLKMPHIRMIDCLWRLWKVWTLNKLNMLSFRLHCVLMWWLLKAIRLRFEYIWIQIQGGGNSSIFYFYPGEMIQFDKSFSDGLKPPTSKRFISISVFSFSRSGVVRSNLHRAPSRLMNYQTGEHAARNYRVNLREPHRNWSFVNLSHLLDFQKPKTSFKIHQYSPKLGFFFTSMYLEIGFLHFNVWFCSWIITLW